MNDRCNCAGSNLASFLLGAVVGAALGVMFAPAKGETTRRRIKNWADEEYEEQKEKISETAAELKEKLTKHANEVKEKLTEEAKDVKDKLTKEFNKRKEELTEKFKKD